MNLLKRITTPKTASPNPAGDQSALAELALKSIHDGVIMTGKTNTIQFINPAAVTMTGCGSANNAIGLDYGLVLKLESKEGRVLTDQENPLIRAMNSGEPLESFQASLIVGQSEKRIPVCLSVLPSEGLSNNKIITFRDITRELEAEGEQTEFISTASHEMRTPVASIEGYLSLCLNPQTATIDERAHGYLEAAHAASKHLGKLFQDLLDVTKLDDGRIKPQLVPVDMVQTVNDIMKDYLERAQKSRIKLTFGSANSSAFGEGRVIQQVAYSFVDLNFIREIMDNLIENALKYTPEGGSVYVNVRGDGDRVLVNVTDSGIGISPDDLAHIFQKFYRVDNSDTRTIGGTGLGLYLVKQRAEAMGGRVWAESAFGEGSTFFVSLPRLSNEEYEKRMIPIRNQQMQEQLAKTTTPSQPAPTPLASAPTPAPAVTTPVSAPVPPTQPAPVPPTQPAPASPAQPAPVPPAQPVPTPPASPPPTSPPASPPISNLVTPNNINLNGENK